jgi:predicted outer membrane protein
VVWQTWRSTPTAAAPGQDGWVSTQWGPLGPADRDLLVRVRLAGLWEHPTGQELAERGTTRQVREAGSNISKEHLELDELVVDTAKRLGVQLPNQPSSEQRAWMSQISAATGASYDWTAVNLLRQAHGSVLPTIINVRVGTRNELVRQFADQAAAFVSRHISYLESTGLVDFNRLDEPPSPARAVVTRAGEYENVPVALLALASFVILAGLGVLIARLVTGRSPITGRHPADSAHRSPKGRSS